MRKEISDLPLATYLSMKGYCFTTDNKNPKRVNFVFDSPNLDEEIKLYYNRQATVEPQKFFAELKTMKTRLYNNY